MLSITNEHYSNYWKNLDTVIMYRHPNFQYKDRVIITDFYNCLISSISQSKFYDTRNNNIEVDLYDEDYIKILKQTDNSVVVISNIINQSKLTLDMLKRNVELFVARTGIPLMCFFVLVNNCLSKPHTGSWILLNGFYKHASSHIRKAIIVSNNGGLVVDKERRNGMIESFVAYSDIDRCFAHNTNNDYYTIDEFIDYTIGDINNPQHGKRVKFAWNNDIIAPETRVAYCDAIQKLPRVNILERLSKIKNKDSYVIIIMGPPRCGKTMLANSLIKKWQASDFGEYNAIQLLSRANYTKTAMYKKFCKLVDDRISCVIDGCCDNKAMRKPYLSYLKGKNVGVLFVEINIGLEMAKVLNHACVDSSRDESVVLYKSRDYNIYKATFERPTAEECTGGHFIAYSPLIEQRNNVMLYRY